MPNLICRGLSFAYDGSASSVFINLDLVIDTAWRTALVGTNGRGKTTLLKLLAGELTPDRGEIERPVRCQAFVTSASSASTVWEAAKDMAGPFRAWEAEIEALLARADESALERYGVLEAEYRTRGGYELDTRLGLELGALGIAERQWQRPLASLSGGEQTRCLLGGLFALPGAYPLIDEPTNHLDRAGRERVAQYLADKPGFLLVSHDRAFLDAAIDHVVALNADTVSTQRADYSTWRSAHMAHLAEQARTNVLLRQDIRRLERVARDRRRGADARESDKTAGGRQRLPADRVMDKGYIGARAARQMKRAIAAERRARQAVQARRDSLVDLEKHYPLRLKEPPTQFPMHDVLVRVSRLQLLRDAALFEPLSFDIRAGERLALQGANGSGKSSLLDLLTGTWRHGWTGEWGVHPRITVSRAWQRPRWRDGLLRDHLRNADIEESPFRQIMARLGVRGGVLDGPLTNLSQGQLKKIELARALSAAAHVYVLDEPLNYVDVDAREGIESALANSSAAVIFVEHDAHFVERLATSRITLRALAKPAIAQA